MRDPQSLHIVLGGKKIRNQGGNQHNSKALRTEIDTNQGETSQGPVNAGLSFCRPPGSVLIIYCEEQVRTLEYCPMSLTG